MDMGSGEKVITVVIPTFGRADRMSWVAANVHENTVAPHRVLFIVERDDKPSAEAAGALVDPGITDWWWNTRIHSYAGAINTAARYSKDELLFIGADDLNFHPHWDQKALWQMRDGIRVVGTADLTNEAVGRGIHATHYLVDARYIEEPGGVIDGPRGMVLFEGYDHQYTDTEFIGTARFREVFAPCLDAVVEHVHINKAGWDATYVKGHARIAQDEQLYLSRRALWHGEDLEQ